MTGEAAGSQTEVQSTGRGWNPGQYDRFRGERQQPFFDLAALVARDPGMRVADLGCGTGELTAWLHTDLGARETVGLDHSAAMLGQSAPFAVDGLRFEAGDILDFAEQHGGEFDLVFSNAALQWLAPHEAVFPAVIGLARPGGQVAVQMPANTDHASHRLAGEVAREAPFAAALRGWTREDPVRPAAWYAELLQQAGCVEQHVRVQIYGHTLASTRAIVEWVKGSLLTAYLSRLPEDLHGPFLERYEARLLAAVGEHEPYFYAFPRVLMWGRLAG